MTVADRKCSLFSTLFSLVIFFSSFNSSCAQDTINWTPTYELTWNDFKGMPDSTKTNFDAVSSIRLNYTLVASSDRYSFEIFCFFQRPESWARLKDNNDLLQHERGHFNIAEIYARKLKQAFKNYKFNASSIKQDFKSIFENINREWGVLDKQYDDETNFSENQNKQNEWNRKIQHELYVVSDY